MNQYIRCSVRSMYDLQKLRIQNGNRIVAAFRHKLDLDSSQAEDENEDAHLLLETLRKEFSRMTDGVKRITKAFKCDSPLISNRGELAMIESYERQLEAEKIHEKAILDELEREPIYTEYLRHIKGVGPLMAGVLLSEIDIHKANSMSALMKYCGLDVVVWDDDEGRHEEGRSKKRNHLEPKTYINREGKEINTVGITYNPFLKTKLVGVLGDIFVKLRTPVYRDIYDNKRIWLDIHPNHKDKTKLHKYRYAVRIMIKQFLSDLWEAWRLIEGLPTRPSYAEEKLGIIHSKPKPELLLEIIERYSNKKNAA